MRYRGSDARQGTAVIGGLAVLTTLVLAGAARGGPSPPPTCSYDSAAKELTVTATAAAFFTLARDGDEIAFSDNFGPLPCTGTPTVDNVDHITVTETGDDQASYFSIYAPGPLHPVPPMPGTSGC